MQPQAITTPLLGTILMGGLALGLAAGYGAPTGTACELQARRHLVLHAVDEPNAIYLSAFRDKSLWTSRAVAANGELQALRYEVRARIFDGCEWLGIETLKPVAAETYVYEYSEVVLECAEGAIPALKTPRTGLVTVER